jgi:hypothetical protein
VPERLNFEGVEHQHVDIQLDPCQQLVSPSQAHQICCTVLVITVIVESESESESESTSQFERVGPRARMGSGPRFGFGSDH